MFRSIAKLIKFDFTVRQRDFTMVFVWSGIVVLNDDCITHIHDDTTDFATTVNRTHKASEYLGFYLYRSHVDDDSLKRNNIVSRQQSFHADKRNSVENGKRLDDWSPLCQSVKRCHVYRRVVLLLFFFFFKDIIARRNHLICSRINTIQINTYDNITVFTFTRVRHG